MSFNDLPLISKQDPELAAAMKAELKRVVWPSFAKIRQNSFIVLVYVFLVGVVIWVLDWLFTSGMNLLINR